MGRNRSGARRRPQRWRAPRSPTSGHPNFHPDRETDGRRVIERLTETTASAGSAGHHERRIGGAPRFGSCHLRLAGYTLNRTTFCLPDSALELSDFGTAERFDLLRLVYFDIGMNLQKWACL